MASSESSGSPSEMIERTAIRSRGRVGSLYDGCQDCILQKLQVNTKETSSASEKYTKCELIKGDAEKSRNVLEMIDIESDLRLSILLIPEPRRGVDALIDHSHLFNEYTRFLHYTYVNRIEELDAVIELPNLSKLLNANETATHIITSVSWGITFVAVLQLSPNADTVTTIDGKLENMQAMLRGDANDAQFSLDDQALFEKNVRTKIYSNISDLSNMTSLFAVCQYLGGRSEQFNLCYPIKYLLKPTKYICPQYTGPQTDFSSFRSSSIANLEEYLIDLLNKMKKLKCSIDDLMKSFVSKHLDERLNQIQQEWIDCNNVYKRELKRIQKVIVKIRLGDRNIAKIDKILEDRVQTKLNRCIEELTRNVDELETKRIFITTLHDQHFAYCNAATLNVQKEDYKQTLPDKLMTENQKEKRILCSTDALNEKNQSEFNSSRGQLSKEYADNPELYLIYADFSYCSFELPDIMVLPYNKHNDNASVLIKCSPSLAEDEVINILLLGESGVGKSTFINAFVNYLVFETLEKAESKKPVVLIPVSFLVTTGHNYDERSITFGTSDNFNNENFDHPGESVTQHCKSYMFILNRTSGKKLRIIDTPGFGDTRGLDQDDLNMQHILKYVNNFTHLNAICFLLKPTATRLNSYFSICLAQLLDLLGSNARENIIFCFTNARPTFYTPGDAASLLKTMLGSFSVSNIAFRKENVFCFDNEAFRYLVALQNSVLFDNLDRNEYEKSWSTSLKESNRLVNYVTTRLKVYSLHNKQQSIKKAQIEITYMIRPILEAMRNIIRHIIMNDTKILNKSIKLKPIAVHRPASKCLSCKLDVFQIGAFLFAEDDPHEMLNRCYQCSCHPTHHNPIDYILHYELSHQSPNYNRNQMDEMLKQLCVVSNAFAYFLTHVVRSTKSDPFSTGLMNMLVEESRLREMQNPHYLNSKLVENLKKLQSTYEDSTEKMNLDKQRIDLTDIYRQIQKIRTLPEVREQLAAVEETRRILMIEYEYVVPEDLTT